MSTLANTKEDLDSANIVGQDLLNETDTQIVNAAPIEDDLVELNDRFETDRTDLEREETKLENVIDNVEAFQGALSQFESWLPEAMLAVQSFKPISCEPEEIQRQLKEVEVSFYSGIIVIECIFFGILSKNNNNSNNNNTSSNSDHNNNNNDDDGGGNNNNKIMERQR